MIMKSNNPLAADPKGRGAKLVARREGMVAAPLWSAEAERSAILQIFVHSQFNKKLTKWRGR